MTHKFQKLNVSLPRQPLSNQRFWEVAGLLFALLILLFIAYSYIDYRNDPGSFQQMNEKTSEAHPIYGTSQVNYK